MSDYTDPQCAMERDVTLAECLEACIELSKQSAGTGGRAAYMAAQWHAVECAHMTFARLLATVAGARGSDDRNRNDRTGRDTRLRRET
jgi:hypothetical protein